MEEYIVRIIKELPRAPPSEVVDSVRYPPTDMPKVINSELILWEVNFDSNFFSWSYWKSMFGFPTPPVYNVILHQKNDDFTCDFLLYDSESLETATDAFKELQSTLQPLVNNCTVMLTKELLKQIVLPKPVKPHLLSHHLTEVMESNPDAQPDWVKVMQSLMRSAIGHDDADAIDELINKGAPIAETDSAGNTILHTVAASGAKKTWKRVMRKLKKKDSSVLLGTINLEGNTPVQIAFKRNLADMVMAIINSGVNLASETDADGCNPLHVAAKSGCEESILAAHNRRENQRESFLSVSSPERQHFLDALNAVNNAGLTPLMVAVQKGYVGSVIILLQAGADPNIQQSESGETALHMAAKMGNVTITESIVAFRGNINIRNNAGKTALEEAKKSSSKNVDKCIQLLEETTELFEKAEAELSDSVEPPSALPSDSTILLSLDGGGTRALLSCQILIAIHERMKQLQPNCAALHKYFDYIAGTSAGNLLLFSLVYCNASPQASIAVFFKNADELLTKCPNCPQEIAEASMIEMFGSSGLLTDVQTPRVIATTCLADRNPPVLELMCNYRSSLHRTLPWKCWEAMRATTAAPTNFPPFERRFVDGGLMANNPTLDAMSEIVDQAKREGKDAKFGLVVSVGTGIAPDSEVQDVNVYVPQFKNFFRSVHNLAGTISGLHCIFQLFIAQSTQTDGQKVHHARSWCESMGVPFYRFTPELTEPSDMAEARKEKLVHLMYIGLLYTLRNAKKLDAVAKMLLSRSIEYS